MIKMKISELIGKLLHTMSCHGDIPVTVQVTVSYPNNDEKDYTAINIEDIMCIDFGYECIICGGTIE